MFKRKHQPCSIQDCTQSADINDNNNLYCYGHYLLRVVEKG